MNNEFYFDEAGSESRTNRYDLANFMRHEQGRFDPFTSYFLNRLAQLPAKGTFTITTEEFRPQLISYKIYNDNSLWQILLHYTGKSIMDLKSGVVISWPSLQDLEKLYFDTRSKASKSNK